MYRGRPNTLPYRCRVLLGCLPCDPSGHGYTLILHRSSTLDVNSPRPDGGSGDGGSSTTTTVSSHRRKSLPAGGTPTEANKEWEQKLVDRHRKWDRILVNWEAQRSASATVALWRLGVPPRCVPATRTSFAFPRPAPLVHARHAAVPWWLLPGPLASQAAEGGVASSHRQRAEDQHHPVRHLPQASRGAQRFRRWRHRPRVLHHGTRAFRPCHGSHSAKPQRRPGWPRVGRTR